MADKVVTPEILWKFASIVPAAIIVGATLLLFNANRLGASEQTGGKLPGALLSAMKDIYPVQIQKGVATLDLAVFVKALKEVEQRNSQRAIADLVYLGQTNKVYPLLPETDQKLYDQFLRQNRAVEQDMTVYMTNHLKQQIVLAEALGKTFESKVIEVTLYDARNPVRSVVVVKNAIAGLRADDPANEDLIRYFENVSTTSPNESTLVAQKQTLKDGRKVKTTMIPFYDEEYGLTSVIGITIDTSRLDPELYPEDAVSLVKSLGLSSGSSVH